MDEKSLVAKHLFTALLCGIMLMSFVFMYSEDIYAFNKQGAREYADAHVYSTAIGYFPRFSSNCTNFVSQVMHEGGGLGQNYNWYYNNYTNYSRTWAIADELKNHIKNHGIGVKVGSWSKNGDFLPYAYINNSNNIFGGDEVIFYDWEKDWIMDHASFCVRTGSDYQGHGYGDLIDQNTKDRKNAIWHLDPYNKHRETTGVYAFRLY